jgi:hypothetical protein
VHNYIAQILPQYRIHPTRPQLNLQTNAPKRKIHWPRPKPPHNIIQRRQPRRHRTPNRL